MAACSAIEYFYAYWFWKMDGQSKILNAISSKKHFQDLDDNARKRLRKSASSSRGKTPYLSMLIRFLLKDLAQTNPTSPTC